jgi:hypothetical protein
MVISFLATSSFGQNPNYNSYEGLIIDQSIIKEVKKHIKKSELDQAQGQFQIYNARMYVDFFEDDSLIASTYDQEIYRLAKSFYYWKKDTLKIDGAIGLFGGFGFTIEINGGKAVLSHLLASDEFPSYSYKENDDLIFRLQVPCTDTRIILSEIPDQTKNPIIYGFVEFKSKDYYSITDSVGVDGTKLRQKSRVNMKMYFKSGKATF